VSSELSDADVRTITTEPLDEGFFFVVP